MALVILVCDDELGTRTTLQNLFEERHEVLTAQNGLEALEVLKKREVDVVITDNMMPQMTGLELIKAAKPLYTQTHFLLMTAYGKVEQAVEAIKAGAEDYILKPFELADIEHRVARFEKLKSLERKRALSNETVSGVDRIVGTSTAVREMKQFVQQVAAAPTSVLLLGPSGSGKEVMSKAIHDCSDRKDQTFVSINCACLTENLLESELFGHEKGAFTGAVQTKIGKFELANGGTLFLDEIGELPLSLQAKLLRVLQDKEFYRLGGQRLIKSDVRIIAATNRSLSEMVQQGQFREDLFFRINVISFQLKPLCERKEDILTLTDYFLTELSPQFNKSIQLPIDVREALVQYDYPGNIRELRNLIERLIVLTPNKAAAGLAQLPFGAVIKNKNVSAQVDAKNTFDYSGGLTETLDGLEKQIIEEVMAQTQYNQVRAAEVLKITRGALQYKLKKYNVKSGAA